MTRRPITEQPNDDLGALDALSTPELLAAINREDARVPTAVATELPAIARAVDAVAERLRRDGRLLLIGAGTSGRLALMQAAEVPPTFGTPPSLVLGILAGGPDALARPREAAEDDPAAGAEEMRRSGVRTEDAVVGISASGRTPFVLGAVEEAGRRGALTIGLACDDPTPLAERVDIAIHPIVGPEVLAGSTRLKAGTAQKLVLDMLTTAVMTRLGRVHHNLMVGVRASNAKLIDRARRIVADVTGRPVAEAQAALADAEGSAAVAIVMLTRGLPADEARDLLATTTLGELLDGTGGAVDA